MTLNLTITDPLNVFEKILKMFCLRPKWSRTSTPSGRPDYHSDPCGPVVEVDRFTSLQRCTFPGSGYRTVEELCDNQASQQLGIYIYIYIWVDEHLHRAGHSGPGHLVERKPWRRTIIKSNFYFSKALFSSIDVLFEDASFSSLQHILNKNSAWIQLLFFVNRTSN